MGKVWGCGVVSRVVVGQRGVIDDSLSFILYAYSTCDYVLHCLYVGTCPTLANPANGRVIVVGQSAFYVCNTNYITVGNPFNSCVGGKWTSPPAICKLS